MRIFSPQEDSKIYNACEHVRSMVVALAEGGGSINPNGAAAIVLNNAGSKSVIKKLIEAKKWEELFANKDWLDVLKMGQDLSCGIFSLIQPLKTIIKYFRKETAKHLVSELIG